MVPEISLQGAYGVITVNKNSIIFGRDQRVSRGYQYLEARLNYVTHFFLWPSPTP
jgi:hypothetical protein